MRSVPLAGKCTVPHLESGSLLMENEDAYLKSCVLSQILVSVPPERGTCSGYPFRGTETHGYYYFGCGRPPLSHPHDRDQNFFQTQWGEQVGLAGGRLKELHFGSQSLQDLKI